MTGTGTRTGTELLTAFSAEKAAEKKKKKEVLASFFKEKKFVVLFFFLCSLSFSPHLRPHVFSSKKQETIFGLPLEKVLKTRKTNSKSVSVLLAPVVVLDLIRYLDKPGMHTYTHRERERGCVFL
jgi:phosphatidylglycerophosphate synthase